MQRRKGRQGGMVERETREEGRGEEGSSDPF